MKKIVLSAAALMIGFAAMAQDTGARKAVQVAQIPGSPATANTGLSTQIGLDNAVQVGQAGTENSALTLQDGEANQALIMQTGNVNGNQALSGQLNLAEVDQSGFANESMSIQEGDLNNAFTQQTNDAGAGSVGNRALITQGTADQAESNDAAIIQDGQDNSALTLQTWDNNDAATYQTGESNASEISQNAGPENSAGHFAVAEQMGMQNESRIDQSGANGDQDRNTAFTRQQGAGNAAEQIQVSTGAAGGNSADVMQGYTGVMPDYSTVQLDLFDDVNNFDTSLADDDDGAPFTATNAVALQTQTGGENDAVIVQFADRNEAVQFQDGDGNVVQSTQNLAPDIGFLNVTRQTQLGDNNMAAVVQNDRVNTAVQFQDGNDNNIITAQRGTANEVDAYQEGDASYAQTLQHGNTNAILLTQRDGQSYTVRQNENQFGNNGANQADILQEGPTGAGVQRAFGTVAPQGLTAPTNVTSFTLGTIGNNN